MSDVREPVYSYRKGQGWVIGPEVPTYSRNIGLYKLTLEQRKPNPGERWWLDSQKIGLEKYTDAVKRNWNFNVTDLPEHLGTRYERFVQYDDDTTVFYTIKLERL